MILAIDPGYDRLGWAVGYQDKRHPQVIALGCIQTDKNQPIFRRYQQISQELEKLIKQYQPVVAAIEELYFSKNTKTAMRVSEARGATIQVLLNHQLAIFEYGPTTIKQVVTGDGRANKKAIAKMVKLQLKLDDQMIDDALDAAACYLTHVLLQRKTQN